MAGPMSLEYAYPALSSSDLTRVIELHPASERSDPLNVTLKEVSLANDSRAKPSVAYEALSYVWGPKKSNCYVHCRGKCIPVTPNCEKALRYLRGTKESRTLWIDAICIDQTNMTERSQQVQKMGDIYRSAARVVIWIGEANSLTAPAFDFLRGLVDRKLPSALHKSWYRLKGGVQNYSKRSRQFTSKTAAREAFNLDNWKDQSQGDGKSLRYIRQLLDNSYFHRIWTIQEVAMAKEAIVLCGEISVPWEKFAQGGTEFIWSEPVFTTYEDGTRRLIKTDFKVKCFQDHYRCSQWKRLASLSAKKQVEITQNEGDARLHQIRALVSTAHSHEASEPKDRVFGLYPLFLDLEVPIAAPLYDPQQSVESVYIEAIKAIIRGTKSLSILDSIVSRTREPLLPSWAHDLRYETQYTYTKLWNASGNSEVNFQCLDASLDGHLEVDGIVIGNISRLGATLPVGRQDESPVPYTDEEFPAPRWMKMLECFRGWLEILDEQGWEKYSPTGEKTTEALFQLLTCPEEIFDDDTIREAFEFWYSTVRKLWREPLPSEQIDRLLEFNNHATTRWWSNDLDVMHFLEMVDKEEGPNMAGLFRFLWQNNHSRCFFLTDSGHLGIGHGESQPHDSIVILAGATMPMILRPQDSSWQLIGPAVIHGAMDGQLWSARAGKDSGPLTTFSIV